MRSIEVAGSQATFCIVISAAGMYASTEIIRLARELNPALRILARTAYVRELPALHQAGAERVFSGEGEVALAVTEAILRALGATPEQIDQERERVHTDLFGSFTVA